MVEIIVCLLIGAVIGFVVGFLVKRNNKDLEAKLMSQYALMNADMKERYGLIEKNLNDEIARLKAKLGV